MSKSATTKPVAKQEKHDVAVVATSSQSVVYSGPLPPASEMAQYEKYIRVLRNESFVWQKSRQSIDRVSNIWLCGLPAGGVF